jgi:hypothetical protein
VTVAILPTEFVDLEPFAHKWCLATETERYAMRLSSTMPEMRAFYDAFSPRAKAVLAYCDRYGLEDLPEEVLNLMHLFYSVIVVSFPVETWGQPRVPDSGAAMLECFLEPSP